MHLLPLPQQRYWEPPTFDFIVTLANGGTSKVVIRPSLPFPFRKRQCRDVGLISYMHFYIRSMHSISLYNWVYRICRGAGLFLGVSTMRYVIWNAQFFSTGGFVQFSRHGKNSRFPVFIFRMFPMLIFFFFSNNFFRTRKPHTQVDHASGPRSTTLTRQDD